jgi:hypothetical protein
LGRVVATPAALQRAAENNINVLQLLARHCNGDWGDVVPADRRANEEALKSGARIFSVYGTGQSKLWIITDAETDACPACWAAIGVCEPDKGEQQSAMHFRSDLPARRLSTTVLRPEDY